MPMVREDCYNKTKPPCPKGLLRKKFNEAYLLDPGC